jgi:predicted alpha/beta hydrolase family esterase
VKCVNCGLDHRGWISCAKARADAKHSPTRYVEAIASAMRRAPKLPEPDLSKDPPSIGSSLMVVHEPSGSSQDASVVVHSKHGQYANPEQRKAYRREWMRKRRAG